MGRGKGRSDQSVTDEQLLAAYPAEPVDHDTKAVYQGFLDHRLLVNRCRSCDRWHAPPSPSCPSCWSFDVAAQEVSGRGRVYFVVRLHQGPATPGVDYTSPYPVATVELAEQEGLRVTAPLVGCNAADIAIGLPVSVTWIERSGSPFPAFEPSGVDDAG
jgi:uncharacterized OB-fold protein